MAVLVTPNLSSVRLYLDKGQDENLKDITATRTYSNIASDAADQDIYDVMVAIANLQKYELLTMVKVENSVLTDNA